MEAWPVPKSSISTSMPSSLMRSTFQATTSSCSSRKIDLTSSKEISARGDVELAQALDQLLVVQAAHGDIDRGLGNAEAGGPPAPHVGQRLLQNDAVDRGDHVQLFGDLHEARRRQYLPVAALPAGERLDADDLQRFGVELRLVMGNELVRLQPRQDVVCDPLGGDDLGLKRVVEELVAVAAAALGPIEGNVGVDEQTRGVGMHVAVAGDADRAAEAAFVAVKDDRPLHAFDERAGEAGQAGRLHGSAVDRAAHHYDELVAAHAGNEVVRTHSRLQHLGGMHQHGVAGRMARACR